MYREKGGYSQQQRREKEIDKVIEKISKMRNLDELTTKDFAATGGHADIIARELKNRLRTAQLRKFFDAVRGIEKKLKKGSWKDIENEFYLLQPQLAYAAGRKVGGQPIVPKEFYELMKTCIQKVVSEESNDEQKERNFFRFLEFFEAIVAYHKYHEEVS